MPLTPSHLNKHNFNQKESRVSPTKAFFFAAQHNIFQIKREIFSYKPYISHFIKFPDCILILLGI